MYLKGIKCPLTVFSSLVINIVFLLLLILLSPTKEEVSAFARVRLFVCLSVCEQDYSKTHAWMKWIWMKCCVSTDVGTWTN